MLNFALIQKGPRSTIILDRRAAQVGSREESKRRTPALPYVTTKPGTMAGLPMRSTLRGGCCDDDRDGMRDGMRDGKRDDDCS